MADETETKVAQDPTDKTSPDKDPGSILSFLKGIPFIGGLAGDGVRSSGAAAGTGAIGLIYSLDIPALWKAGFTAFLAAVWMLCGVIKKPAATLLLGAILLSGCCSAEVKARDSALRGVIATHDALDPDCLTPNPTTGQKALIDSARLQREAAHRLVDGK